MMMVNELNDNSTPWQNSGVPKQMPWMNSYEPSAFLPMQFGLQPTTANHVTSNLTQILPPNLPPNLPPILPQNIPQNLPQHLPQSLPHNSQTYVEHHPQKRSSIEMEEDEQQMMMSDTPTQESTINDTLPPRPPQKQVLTERKLFKKFGSLHLDPNLSKPPSSSSDSDESDEDNNNLSKDSDNHKSTFAQGREEFQRYVYLLYKDSNSKSHNNNVYPPSTSLAAIERLAREEREKLSKALVLWNPPVENRFNFESSLPRNDEDICDANVIVEEDMTYNDHTDFLKKSFGANSSIIITDVTDVDFNPSLAVNDDPSCVSPDDIMSD